MKYDISFLLEFPETKEGRDYFLDVFSFVSELEGRAFLFPSHITTDEIEGLLTYPKIHGRFKLKSEELFKGLLIMLNDMKNRVIDDSVGYIKYHECHHDEGGTCGKETIEEWSSPEILVNTE